jgi:hypothetical protein
MNKSEMDKIKPYVLGQGPSCITKTTEEIRTNGTPVMANLKGHPRFYELLDEAARIHSAKNQDYAKESDPLANLKQCEKLGIPSYIGCFIRMQDKFSRLTNLFSGQEAKVKDESIADTLTDLAVYSLLCRVLWEEKI